MTDFKTTPCRMCQAPVEYEAASYMGIEFKPNVCDECSAKWEADQQKLATAELRIERQKLFTRTCPTEMQTIDATRLPCGEAKLERCLAFPLTSRGLVIHGVTGMGKTRILWQLARRLIVEELRGVKVMRDAAFGRSIERAYASGIGDHDKMIAKLCTVPVLMIDDLGKAKLTERVESDLFDIIDSRYARGLPCVFSTQFVGETLEDRFNTLETGEALVRRIRETCDGLPLTPKQSGLEL